MNRIELISTLTMGVFLSFPAFAGDWELLNVSDKLDKATLYDRETIKVCDGTTKVWIADVFRKIKLKQRSDLTLSLYEFDCNQNRFRVTRFTAYFRGRNLGTLDLKNKNNWEHIIPGTIGWNSINAFCKNTPPYKNISFKTDNTQELVKLLTNFLADIEPYLENN